LGAFLLVILPLDVPTLDTVHEKAPPT
jgi:hypothetical protein